MIKIRWKITQIFLQKFTGVQKSNSLLNTQKSNVRPMLFQFVIFVLTIRNFYVKIWDPNWKGTTHWY